MVKQVDLRTLESVATFMRERGQNADASVVEAAVREIRERRGQDAGPILPSPPLASVASMAASAAFQHEWRPSVEERLTRYRAAAMGGLLADPDIMSSFHDDAEEGTKFPAWLASESEGYAHAMLAAERKPEGT